MKSLISQAPTQQDAWRLHLQDVFASLNIPPSEEVDHVAASIAMYCRQFHASGVQRADLVLLIARAYCALGRREHAERVLSSMQPHKRHGDRWLEILSELHHFPDLLPYFSLGIIRPADWAGAQLDRMWTLDFGRLNMTEAEQHEMMLYRSVRAIVEHMFIFWDATGGEGVLGLKGLASLTIATGSRNAPALTTPAQLIDYIADLFRQQARGRSWTHVPELLNLDL